MTVEQVVDRLSAGGSTWGRADVLRTICDLTPPVPHMSAQRWTAALERACDQVLNGCVNLDPGDASSRRPGDGRSVWIEPVAPQYSSDKILAEEEHVIAWSIDAHETPGAPSTTIDATGLDVMQAAAAAAVAGNEGIVLVVGPAGTGKTRTLERAVEDLRRQHRVVFGVAPTAKAARTLQRDAHVQADTVAKLLHEWSQPDRPPTDRYRLPAGSTVLIDEAGMIGTGSLHRLVTLAEHHQWRLVMVGDPRQLQAVGRGGMFHQLCRSGPVHELQRIHRFTHRWEAAASLRLRAGDPAALDAYLAHDRIVAGGFEQHAVTIATQWIEANRRGETVAITAATNDHVDELNRRIQLARVKRGEIDACEHVRIAGQDVACVGDVIATRRNNRQLTTSSGEPVRNRDLWTVTARHGDGSITVAHRGGHGTVTLAGDYVRDHVRLGYAATEHGTQSDTVTLGIHLASTATGRRGLYVGATRGRARNTIHVVTDSDDLDEARDVLEAVLASDRVDIPAVAQRHHLAQQLPAQARAERAPAEPVPRCTVPAVFGDVEMWAGKQLTAAREAIRTSDQRRRELDERTVALDQAAAAYESHRGAVEAAESSVRDAERAVHHAKRRVGNAGLRDRRPARTALVESHRRLVVATQRLEQLMPTAGTLRERYVKARGEHEVARRMMVATEILDSWNDPLRRVDHVEPLLDALGAWKRWALGHDIPTSRLADGAALLREAAGNRPHEAIAVAADIVDDWTNELGLDLRNGDHRGVAPARNRALIAPTGVTAMCHRS